jgi:hypothetical protein
VACRALEVAQERLEGEESKERAHAWQPTVLECGSALGLVPKKG